MERPTSRGSFPAMSTTVTIIGVGVSGAELRRALDAGRALYERWDRTFSRFRPDSELARLNANAGSGRPQRVSDLFAGVLEAALAGARLTGHRFDPTILPALERAGYDRDFAELRGRPAGLRDEPEPVRTTAAAVAFDRERATLTLPAGTRLDLGGIAKGAFVDRLAADLRGWPGGCVDAGGDLFVWGDAPSGDSWVVGIEDPMHAGEDHLLAEIGWPAIGVATSGANRRRWRVGGREEHHLIDPATCRPLPGPIRTATAFAPTVAAAEIAAKALLVAAGRGEPLAPWGSARGVLLTTAGDRPLRQIVSSTELEETDAPPCRFATPDPLLRSA